MRTFIAFLLISFLTIPAFAQSTADLDQRNGFKAIKIGDKYSKYQSNLKLLSTDSKTSSSIYEYTPSDGDLYNVFDTKMLQILLTFDKNNNLVAIMLHKFFNGQSHFQTAIDASKDLNGKFIALFGKASSKIDVNTSDDMRLGLMWIASKVNLQSYVEYYGLDKGSDIKVVITNNQYAENSFKSGF